MPPRKRLPMTTSHPSRHCSMKRGNLRKVVAVIGVAHDHKRALGFLDSASQGGTVAPLWDSHDPSAVGFGKLDGTIGGPVVGDDHFSGQPVLRKSHHRFVDADGNGIHFVQTRYHDRDFDLLSGRWPGYTVVLVGWGKFVAGWAAWPDIVGAECSERHWYLQKPSSSGPPVILGQLLGNQAGNGVTVSFSCTTGCAGAQRLL